MPTTLRKEVGTAMSSHAPQGNQRRSGAAGPFGTGHADRVLTVLAISPFDEDHIYLRHLFSHSNWQIHQARSCGEALAVLHEHPVPVVLCDSEMPDGSWKDALSELADLPEAPLMIVTSRLADDNLWAEVLNLGGYDVLMKPFDRLEVLRVISLAWLHWKQRRERIACREAGAQLAAG